LARPNTACKAGGIDWFYLLRGTRFGGLVRRLSSI
jgi:hypothetical protein